MAKKQFKAESKRLMDLMVNSIYTHKEIFLRELISNASDALDKLSYRALTDDSLAVSRPELKITVAVDKDARTITVSDNGVGMSAADMEQNLGVIAKSGTRAFRDGLDPEKAGEVDVIGQFGVGFYSAFMVSDLVTVTSLPAGESAVSKWESAGADGYTIVPAEKAERGTEIVLHIKPDTEDEKYGEFLEAFRLRSLIKKYSDFIRWPIVMDGETVNSRVPIWQRGRKDVTDAELETFYREKYYDAEGPLRSVFISAEGLFSYKALLFIPKAAPYNYYTRDYEAGLSLYAGGVMIMDSCKDLLPECFRFARGVVDSQDLSLNISREMLQHDRQLKVIAANIEKKIKAELKKLMEEDRPAYDSFFRAFGLQLKYGVVADFGAKKDMLAELLEYRSSASEGYISLDEYVAAMPEEQKYIYYAIGKSAALIADMPQVEPLRDKGYTVLYLTDEVDEFVANMLGSYKDKELRSVNAEDTGLASDEEKKETEEKEKESRGLLDFVRDSLGGKIAEARLTNKLKSHPVCLAAKGEITLDMEKYFAAVPEQGEKIKAERVLELNAAHPAFAAMQRAFASGDTERAASYAQLLYFEALLLAGMPLDEPLKYSELINSLMS